MSCFIIHGGRPISGVHRAAGNKNAALPMLAAALLTDEPVTLTNLPLIADVRTMLALLEGMDAVWLNTADPRYFNYIKSAVDQFVAPDGSIPTYTVEEYQLDSILLGRQLLFLYGVTQDRRYLTA